MNRHEPTLREILAACGIESTSDRSRVDYHRRLSREALHSIEVTYIDPEVIVLANDWSASSTLSTGNP